MGVRCSPQGKREQAKFSRDRSQAVQAQRRTRCLGESPTQFQEINGHYPPFLSGFATGGEGIVIGIIPEPCSQGLRNCAICAAPKGLLPTLDASGSSYEVQENLARRRMEHAGVVLTTTNTAIAELVQDWSTPQGSELIQLLIATVPKMPQRAA